MNKKKINRYYIDNVVELIDYNKTLGITMSQLDLARQYKIEVDDIIKYCEHAERFFTPYSHYDILYTTHKGYKYNIIIVIE